MENHTETTNERLTRLNKNESKTRLISVKVSPSIEREIMNLSEKMRSGSTDKTHADFLRYLLIAGLWACYETPNYSRAKSATQHAENILDNKNFNDILQAKLEIFQTQLIENQNKISLELSEKLDAFLSAQKNKKWFK